jgi:photosystem II stability/assembly factor-like uncharacterized protein
MGRPALVVLGLAVIGLSACTSSSATARSTPSPAARVIQPVPSPVPTPSPGPSPPQPIYNVVRAQRYPWGGAVILETGISTPLSLNVITRLLVTRDAKRWRDITPPDPSKRVDSFNFIDSHRGWVVMWDCATVEGDLYITIDGGSGWKRVAGVAEHSCSAGSISLADFVDASRGWLASLQPTGPGMGLARSHDGGRTWQPLSRPPLVGYPAFWDAQDGALSSWYFSPLDSSPLYVSNDAGSSWREIDFATTAGYESAFPENAVFFDHMDGVVPVAQVRGDSLGPSGGGQIDLAFYRTYDAGLHWARTGGLPASSPSRATGTGGEPIDVPVSMPSPMSWWAVLRTGPPVVYRTDNGGQLWHREPTVGIPAGLGPVSQAIPVGGEITAIDARHAWMVVSPPSGGGHLYATNDGGASWRELTPPE